MWGGQATEETVPPQALWEATCLLQLKGLLHEAIAIILLTSTQLADAQQHVAALVALHATFPRTLAPLSSATHMLAGATSFLPPLFSHAARLVLLLNAKHDRCSFMRN